MKKLTFLISALLLTLSGYSQIKSFGISLGAGYTAVNIEKAIDWDNLEEWDNFGLMVKATVDFQLKEGLFLVVEAGTNRLYYWEYFWDDGYYSGYRWGTEWTTNFGVQVKKQIAGNFYLLTGPGLHIFNDGSGVVPGLVFETGVDLPLTGKLSLPIKLRVESVFGNATPTSILIGTGVTYNLFAD